jgi:hypothetical protein
MWAGQLERRIGMLDELVCDQIKDGKLNSTPYSRAR